jgi:hypothetical protein
MRAASGARACSAQAALLVLVLVPVAHPERLDSRAPWWLDVEAPGGRVGARESAARACAAGCEQHGNCNLWTGECECPFDRHGTACEHLALPACRHGDGMVDVRRWLGDVTRRGASASPYAGPLSCDCLREALGLRHLINVGIFEASYWLGGVSIICASRAGANASAGVLTVGEVLAEPAQVTWSAVRVVQQPASMPEELLRGLGQNRFFLTAALPGHERASLDALERETPSVSGRQPRGGQRPAGGGGGKGALAQLERLAPLARCARQCNGLGACTARGRPTCACFAGAELERASGSCRLVPAADERELVKAGYGLGCAAPHGRACSAAGACDNNGFCKCERGRWGLDCAHALDARGRPHVRASGASERARDVRASRPRIYVYALPPLLASGPGFYADVFEALTRKVLESAYRTALPDGADYLWLPGAFRLGHAADKLRFVKARWPYWDAAVAAGGRARHVTYQGWELDPGKIFSGRHDAFWPSPLPFDGGARADAEVNVASPTRQWLSISHNGMADSTALEGEAGSGAGVRCVICFQPGKDVVVPFKPGVIDVPACAAFRERSVWAAHAPRRADEGRPIVFFFAGSHPTPKARPNGKPAARGAHLPSHMSSAEPHIRAAIHALHNQTAGFHVVDSRLAGAKVDPVEFMLRSQFCWVPPGQRCARDCAAGRARHRPPTAHPYARSHRVPRLLGRASRLFAPCVTGTATRAGTSGASRTGASRSSRCPTAASPSTSSCPGSPCRSPSRATNSPTCPRSSRATRRLTASACARSCAARGRGSGSRPSTAAALETIRSTTRSTRSSPPSATGSQIHRSSSRATPRLPTRVRRPISPSACNEHSARESPGT